MAIEITPTRVRITDQFKDPLDIDSSAISEGAVVVSDPRDEDFCVEVSNEDLGLLIQALKAYHNTGSFIVGE